MRSNAIWIFPLTIFKERPLLTLLLLLLHIWAHRIVKIITCWSTQTQRSSISQYCIISGQTHWRVHSQCIQSTYNSLRRAHFSFAYIKTRQKQKIIMFDCKLINVSSIFGCFQFDSIVLNYWPLHFNPIHIDWIVHSPYTLAHPYIFTHNIHFPKVNGLISTLFTLCRVSTKAKLIMSIMIYVINEQINLTKRKNANKKEKKIEKN